MFFELRYRDGKWKLFELIYRDGLLMFFGLIRLNLFISIFGLNNRLLDRLSIFERTCRFGLFRFELSDLLLCLDCLELINQREWGSSL